MTTARRLKVELEDLADAACLYYQVFFLGQSHPRKSDNQVEAEFISEVTARLVALREMKPDPTDDPSFSHRLGK